MAIDTNLAQENKSLQQKNQILYQQVELLTKLHQVRQEGLLHQTQNAGSEDSSMKEDQPLIASGAEENHGSEKQLEEGLKQEELKQDDSDVTLGRDAVDENENGGELAQDKDVDQDKDDDKMDEDEDEEEHSSYANSEASDYEGPESWDGDSLGGDPEASDPEADNDDDCEDETMKDEDWLTSMGDETEPKQYESRQSRNYFIAKYKRDKLHNATAVEKELVKNPPSGASGAVGECKLDSWLYFNNGFEETRTDFNAYKSLYGFHPAILDFIEYEPTLRLLDRHAEQVTRSGFPRNPPKQEFHDRFREFVEAFEKADYPSDYLEGDLSSEVARAHLAFGEVLDSPSI